MQNPRRDETWFVVNERHFPTQATYGLHLIKGHNIITRKRLLIFYPCRSLINQMQPYMALKQSYTEKPYLIPWSRAYFQEANYKFTCFVIF